MLIEIIEIIDKYYMFMLLTITTMCFINKKIKQTRNKSFFEIQEDRLDNIFVFLLIIFIGAISSLTIFSGIEGILSELDVGKYINISFLDNSFVVGITLAYLGLINATNKEKLSDAISHLSIFIISIFMLNIFSLVYLYFYFALKAKNKRVLKESDILEYIFLFIILLILNSSFGEFKITLENENACFMYSSVATIVCVLCSIISKIKKIKNKEINQIFFASFICVIYAFVGFELENEAIITIIYLMPYIFRLSPPIQIDFNKKYEISKINKIMSLEENIKEDVITINKNTETIATKIFMFIIFLTYLKIVFLYYKDINYFKYVLMYAEALAVALLLRLTSKYFQELNKLEKNLNTISEEDFKIVKLIKDNFKEKDSIKSVFSLIKKDINKEKDLFEGVVFCSYYINKNVGLKEKKTDLLKKMNYEAYLIYIEKDFSCLKYDKLKYVLFNDLKKNDLAVSKNNHYWLDLLDNPKIVNEFLKLEKELFFSKINCILKNGNISNETKLILEISIIEEKLVTHLERLKQKNKEQRWLYFLKNIKRYKKFCKNNDFEKTYMAIKKITELLNEKNF